MAGTTIWKGSIHFGDTDLPVKLHGAVRDERIQFHLLHRRDGVKLHQQMICAHEKVAVPTEGQSRGFQVEEGKYVIVEPAELEALTPESSRRIELHEFVASGDIDPLFLERSYYLTPEGEIHREAYATLVQAMQEMGVAGICTWTMRKRAYVGALRGSGRTLRLQSLRHADEVIAVSSLDLPAIPLAERELKIGSDLIQQLTAPFRPDKFINDHQQRLKQLIDKKARGEKVALLHPRV
ncbi:MAG TPA: Ku protein, partial [Geobacterales bacterium]|nr:Ku protein [Geobacterales bacterium]